MKKRYFKINPVAGFLLFFVVVGLVGWYVYQQTHEVAPAPKPVEQAVVGPQWFSKLDGTPVDEAKQVPLLLGVMIDNHADARAQQVGLSQARVVYEALAEGSITRYLALFNAADTVAKVGPVRSARPYYLNWIREYGDSTYWHSGGSPEALKMISDLGLPSTNEFFNGQYYWRDHAHEAPHNLFTSSELWTKLLEKRDAEPSTDWNGWLFETVPSTSTQIVKQVTITYAPDYKVTWKFDGARYQRLINTKEQKDGAAMIFADTVVVQEVKMRVLDEAGRKEITSIGSGTVRVFKHGQMVRGIWKKDAAIGRTVFLDEAGKPLPLAPGKIWIQITPINPNVEITS